MAPPRPREEGSRQRPESSAGPRTPNVSIERPKFAFPYDDLYHRLLESLPEIVWITSPGGKLLECNRQWYEYTGSGHQETLSGEGWAQVLHPEDLPRIIEEWNRHLDSGDAWEFDYRLRRRDGVYLWHHAHYMPVLDDQGERFAWVGIAFPIEEAHRTRQERALLAAAVASAEDAIVTKTLQGIVTSWNPAAERIFGYSRDEMVGHSIKKIVPEERRAEVDQILARLALGERIHHLETKRRRKDGEILDIALSISPVRDDTGRIIGASSIKRDITERRRMLGALRESETRFRVMADAVPHLVWTSGPDGAPTYFNRRWSEYAGLDESTPFTLERWFDLIHPEDVDWVGRRWMDSVREGVPFSAEYRLRSRLHPTDRWHLARAVPVRDDGERILQWVGTCTDIDDQKRAEEQLRDHAAILDQSVAEATAELRERNDQMLTFSYSVSHDLRAPLRAMRGYLDVLLDELAPHSNSAIDEYSARIADATQRMDRLITELLNYGRVSVAEFVSEPTPLDEAARAALRQLEPEVRDRNAEVSVDLEGLPPVAGRLSVMTQVFLNLLANALKFVASGVTPRVTVVGERAGDRVRVVVADNGIGIAPEHHEKIFGVFQQLHRQGEFPGTGIGLAMVRRAVERMGGRVDVESELGSGSRFVLDLPVASTPPDFLREA